jgi:hypothetical protein
VGGLVDPMVSLSIKDDLCDAGSIAKIDEDDHAMIAPPLNPPVQDDGLADLFRI